MENGSLVSVIIPVYNVRPYLAEALDSVLQQTYGNIEVIIIDDGSTDGSGAVCDAYSAKDARVRVVHQENKGLSHARNVGLDLISGSAVAFLDSDDAYHPDFLAEMVSSMVREKADIVLCRYTIHKTEGRLIQNEREKLYPAVRCGKYDRVGALRALADGSIGVSVWNKLFRRELWEDIRFPNGHIYEDLDKMYRVFDLCKTVCVMDQPLYLHRKRPGSITQTYSRQHFDDFSLAFAHFNAFVAANTPGIFTVDQLKKWRWEHIYWLIKLYARFSSKALGSMGITDEELIRKIMEEVREVGIENCSLRIKAACRMLCTCPWLLRMLFPIYLPVRSLVWKIFRV